MNGVSLAAAVSALAALSVVSASTPATAQQNRDLAPHAGDFVARDFRFTTGDRLDVRIHYYTLGSPEKDPTDTCATPS